MIEYFSPEYMGAVGFPIAISAFLLWERAIVTQKHIEALNSLRDIMIEVKAVLSSGVR